MYQDATAFRPDLLIPSQDNWCQFDSNSGISLQFNEQLLRNLLHT